MGDQLDTTKWGYRNLGPRRDAINIADAVAVEDGNLVIRTYTSGAGASMQHYTGMIGTQGLFQQKYGYFEARIDFDGLPGMWSAFWVQSPTMGNPIGDPGTAGAEIDIMEHRVINGSGADFQNVAHHALHWDGYGADHKSQNKDTAFPDLADGFHLYGLEWSPTGYRYYVDGQLTWTINQGVSHRDEYLILSSEVQDNNWAGDVPAAGYGSLATTTAKMFVDYVRVYQYAGPGDLNADGFVGIDDLNIVLGHWNQNVPAGNRQSGDASGDGFIGIADLGFVLGDWNNGTPPADQTRVSVPEPFLVWLVAGGGVIMLVRRVSR